MVDWALPLKYKGVADELLTQVSRSSENSYCELVHRLPVTLSSEGIALRQSVIGVSHFLPQTSVSYFLEDFYKSKLFPHPRECSRRCKWREPGRSLCFDNFYQLKSLSRVQLFATPWTVAYQAPLSMGFSRQECWSGLPFPSPGDLSNPGIEPTSPSLQADALASEAPGKPPYQPYLHTTLVNHPAFERLSGGKHTEPVPYT